VLSRLLPTGLLGLFAGLMLAASVTTDDTYLHSWGSIFIQDVIMPFRREPFTPKQHLRVLRWSILGVAVFAFGFSLLFQQSQYIFLFFAITGAIFAGGSGAVIIGGLYWKRGTTAAAWSALATGSTIAVGGIVVHQLVPGFPVNGQMFWGIAMGASSLVYVLVSLLGKREVHNLDQLLHRGAYAVAGESQVVAAAPARGLRVLGMGREFTGSDRLIYVLTYVWTLGWVAVFLVGTIYNLSHRVEDRAWQRFWQIYIYINLAASCLVTVWFALGGIRDIRAMFRRLGTMERDPNDDGRVR
jgi:SSS family solute:Na+ symporter